MALKQLFRLEPRQEKSPVLRQQYNVAMQDYLDWDHMSTVLTGLLENEQFYYISY